MKEKRSFVLDILTRSSWREREREREGGRQLRVMVLDMIESAHQVQRMDDSEWTKYLNKIKYTY